MKRKLARAGVAAIVAASGLFGCPAGPALAQPDADTSAVREVLKRRNAELDSLLNPQSLKRDTTGLERRIGTVDQGFDSLMAQYPDWNREQRLHVSFRPLAFTTYNRVEGVRTGIALGLSDSRWFAADVAGGYGFSNHRWSGMGALTLGHPDGPAVQVTAHDRILAFGPDRIEYGAGFLSLVAGQDRQDYLAARGAGVTLWPIRDGGRSVSLSAFYRDETSVRAHTDYSFFGGGEPIEEPNPAITEGITHGVAVAATTPIRTGLLELSGEAGVAGGGLGGDFAWSWQTGRVTLKPVFPDGGILTVAVEGARVGGDPPAQAVPYLGGDGNLRGYGRLEFPGRSRLFSRIEYATGLDLLGRTGVGVLKKLKLQFIPFADLGSTWERPPRVVDKAGDPLDGELRSSVGLGIQREMWLPGIQAIRLDIIRRTDGSDRPWSFWFRLLAPNSEP